MTPLKPLKVVLIASGVVVFDEPHQAEQAAAGFAVGTSPRQGVTVKRADVLTVEVSA